MATITISPDFFRQEVRNYSDWKTAFWRELFQNSSDAGASKIDIQIADMGGCAIVVFTDNGSGMSREVLEDVFFSLGKTTKTGTGTIGGFGKARIVLCFAQTDYQIHTGTLLVAGSGASYDIGSTINNRKGCEFTITVPYASFGATFNEFKHALRSYLRLSQMSVGVTIDGERWTDWTHKRAVTRYLTFGTVHVNKSGTFGSRMLVRVSGVLMFSKYISASVQLIVEIDPARSRDVLTSNRDGLMSAYSEELDKFCQQVAADTRTALKNNSSTKQILAGNARTFRPRVKRVDVAEAAAEFEPRMPDLVPTAGRVGNVKIEQEITVGMSARSGGVGTHFTEGGVSEVMRDATQEELDGLLVAMGRIPATGGYSVTKEMLPAPPPRDPVLDGLVIVNKSTDLRLKRSAKLFHPGNWGEVHGAKRKKLLKQWIVACEWALDMYCQKMGSNGVDWRPGFVFEEETEAMHQKQEDGSHALMLNPVLGKDTSDAKAGTIRYQLRDFPSHVGLLTLAAHEVTHIAYGWHDEDFANLFTEIVKMCMERINEIHMEMKRVS